jgi:multidrug resistance efflux pump
MTDEYFMISTPTSPLPTCVSTPVNDNWCCAVDVLLDELDRLASSDMPQADFHRHVLRCGLAHLGAHRGAVWLRDVTSLRLCADVDLVASAQFDDSRVADWHQRLLQQAVTHGQWMTAEFPSGQRPAHDSTTAGQPRLIVCPISVESQVFVLYEILIDSVADGRREAPMRSFLEAVGLIVADYERGRLLRVFRRAESVAQQFRDMVLQFHDSLDRSRTATAIANAARTFVGADRVTVLVRRGDDPRIQAISGVTHSEERARTPRSLVQLARIVLASGEPIWFDGDEARVPAELRSVVREYVDHSHARNVLVLPFRTPGSNDDSDRADVANSDLGAGALVVETFDNTPRPDLRPRAEEVCRHAALAIRNSEQYSRIPGGWIWQCFHDRVPRRRSRVWFGAAAACLAIGCLLAMPANLHVTAQGQLIPVQRREVFAVVEGLVDQVHIQHGDFVKRDQPLVQLKSPEIERQRHELFGHIQATRKRLVAAKVSRGDDHAARRSTADRRHESAGEEGALEQRLAGLEAEYAIILRQQRDLLVVSPIAGQVVTWNIEQRLQSRPVQPGNRLLTVADVGGDWGLELYIPETQVGHAVRAFAEQGRQLPVTFVLDSTAEVHTGNLAAIASATRYDETWGNHVLASVTVDKTSLPDARPGALVRARILCGRRSRAFVWFHELVEQARIFFMV